MKLNQVSHDREAESESAKTSCRGTIGLTKSIEYARQKLPLDALARVFHSHTRIRSMLLDAHTDLSAMWCELHRIRQQVPDDLVQARRVGGDRAESGFGVVIQRDTFSISRRLHNIDRRTRHRCNVQ